MFSYFLFSARENCVTDRCVAQKVNLRSISLALMPGYLFPPLPHPPPGVRQSRKSEKLSSRKSETGKASHSPIVWPNDPYTRFLGWNSSNPRLHQQSACIVMQYKTTQQKNKDPRRIKNWKKSCNFQPHRQVITQIYPSIKNLWFRSDISPGGAVITQAWQMCSRAQTSLWPPISWSHWHKMIACPEC